MPPPQSQQRWLEDRGGSSSWFDDDDYFASAYPYADLGLYEPQEGSKKSSYASAGNSVTGSLSDFGFSFGKNQTDWSTDLSPASDVNIVGVKAALYFNLVAFAVLMMSYEVLRRKVPTVYASRRQRAIQRGEEPDDDAEILPPSGGADGEAGQVSRPFAWVGPVYAVPWADVRRVAGLDAYMFLRYIRLCLRITSVSAFWGMLILWPVYGSGNGPYDKLSWYHYSMANIDQGSWRIWVPTGFFYLFSAYIFFVMKQEYRHYVEVRMEFLGRGMRSGSGGVGRRGGSGGKPTGDAVAADDLVLGAQQQTYSVAVERIPPDLRSDRALRDYFNRLFPGKVHSACVVLNVNDLQGTADRTMRVTRRLEKSIAQYHTTGKRPTHIVGRPRAKIMDVECSPLELPCHLDRRWRDAFEFDEAEEGAAGDGPDLRPPRGAVVDSIRYYTQALARVNRKLEREQRLKANIAETGNHSVRASNWITMAADYAQAMDDNIKEESLAVNALFVSPNKPTVDTENTSILPGSTGKKGDQQYGSFDTDYAHGSWGSDDESLPWDEDTGIGFETGTEVSINEFLSLKGAYSPRGVPLPKFWKRLFVRLGFDFFASSIRIPMRRIRTAMETVAGAPMSSSGFVTFYTHEAATVAACADLTHRPNVLKVTMASEPRDLLWENTNISRDMRKGKEHFANILLTIGVVLWSIPLAAIQAFAKAEQLALVPGMEWILNFDGGNLTAFINGYLPVMLLLTLISVLPLVFEYIATTYERRKTRSDIQYSITGRYFYYQIANIYITVTAGAIWKALADILDHPAEILEILGESIPMMVGYFLSLLITKIFAGLPMVMLRAGALSRIALLRACFGYAKLPQRELDKVYRNDNVYYGWEYPSLMLVIMICFAYACMSPVILPVGAVYFFGALLVYKEQVLYVYTATYESGGQMFPFVCDRSLFGLIISQLVFIGYSLIRGGTKQPLVLAPLPFFTMYMMHYFRTHYADPSLKLSLERAVELDYLANSKASGAQYGDPSPKSGAETKLDEAFSANYYRQPVLTVAAGRPLPYRRAFGMDGITAEVLTELNGSRSRYQAMADENRLT